jgi:RNase P/RNase MRP subunit p29
VSQLSAAAVIWLLAAAFCRADRVVLVGGDIIEGTVTKQTKSGVVLEHEDLGRIEIPRSRIESVQIDTLEVEIVLSDGNTVRGKIVAEDESAITIQHKDLGRIKVPRERIASSEVGFPEATIVLAGGDTIEGKVIERTDYAIVVEHPNLGRLEIPRDRIDSLEIKEPEIEKDEKPGWFEPQLRKLAARTSRLKEQGWKLSFDISLDSSSGNTDEQVTRFGGHLEREQPRYRAKLDASYYYKLSEGDTTDNKLTVGLGRDWIYPESVWFWFALGRFDYDEFESWKQRANAQTGPGYHLIESEDMTLDMRLGLGARREWGSENNNPKLEALTGADFQWDITTKQKCVFAPYFFPVVGDLDDYRGRVSGEWRYLFDKDMLLTFVLGTLYEYSRIVDPGKDHGDLRVYLGLRYGF